MLIAIGAFIGALSVGLGAFGSHILRARLSQGDYETFQIAVRYQFYHALLLVIIGIWNQMAEINELQKVGYLILVGITLFSGSLYLIVFTGIKSFGAVAPIGGALLIVSWIYLGIIAIRL